MMSTQEKQEGARQGLLARLRRRAALGVVVAGLLALPAAASAASDLRIDKTDDADPVTVGSELTYTIVVANAGTDAATDVVVVDKLRSRLAFVSASSTQGKACRVNEGGRKVTCALETLGAGASATVQIKVIPNKQGPVVNTATVTSAAPYAEAEADSETTSVKAPPPTAFCKGKPATLLGTPGDDRITGTIERDVIVAFAGNDTIDGVAGRDLICGSAGDDSIKGNGDNDRLRGGTGNDVLRGGGGNDALSGGGGVDVLRGGTGDDDLQGGGGDDELLGGGGFDVLRGGTGTDSLRGGGGEDVCSGGGRRDVERGC